MNMIYATHIPKRERKHALRDVYAVEPVAPKFNPWLARPITFDRRDHSTIIRHGGLAALVLDPIIDGYHLTRVLMDGGSSLSLIYLDTVRNMGIDPSRIKPSSTTFKGVIPGIEARCSPALCLFKAQNSWTTGRHHSQSKYGVFSLYGGGHRGPSSQSPKWPIQAKQFIGCQDRRHN